MLLASRLEFLNLSKGALKRDLEGLPGSPAASFNSSPSLLLPNSPLECVGCVVNTCRKIDVQGGSKVNMCVSLVGVYV